MTSVNPNGFTTLSDVLVGDDGYMYFRGTDNAVWRVNPMNAADNTNFGGPDWIATQSSVVAVGHYMYLRGTDDKVWRVNINTNPLRVNLGGFTTWSDVLVGDDGYLYFRGTDNAVWRVNPSNPADNTNFGGPGVIATQSNVVAVGGYMYLRGTDDKVWRVNIHNPDPNHPQMLNPLHFESDSGGFVTHSNVNCSRGIMYFRGTDDKVWETDGVPWPNPGGSGNAFTVPAAPSLYIYNTDSREIDNLALSVSYGADFGGPYNLQTQVGTFNQVFAYGLNSMAGGVGALHGEGSQSPTAVQAMIENNPNTGLEGGGPIYPSVTITKEDAAEISNLSVTASFTINGQRYSTQAYVGDFNQYFALELNGGTLTLTGKAVSTKIKPAFLLFLNVIIIFLELGSAAVAGIGGALQTRRGEAPGTPGGGWQFSQII